MKFGESLRNRLVRVSALALIAAVIFAPAPAAWAQEESPEGSRGFWDRGGEAIRGALERLWIPRSRYRDGPRTRSAFREVVAEARQATVSVRCGGQEVALGGIVGSDGWILTKASQLDGAVTCRLADGRSLEARVVGVDRQFDLAMLKVEASDLPVLNLDREHSTQVGQWLATVSTGRDPAAIGIVSVGAREIAHRYGILGIEFDMNDERGRVARVVPDSGAERAGLQIDDIVLSINGEPTPTRDQLRNEVRRYSPGDRIEVVVERYDETLTFQATLSDHLEEMGINRSMYQNSLGGELSSRRFGFPAAFQHDTVLDADECGGPVVDLDGRVVGFNLARSGRTESYAIPTSTAVTRFYDLMSGNLAPRDPENLDVEPLDAREIEALSGDELDDMNMPDDSDVPDM